MPRGVRHTAGLRCASRANPSNLNRIMPAEGRLGSRTRILLLSPQPKEEIMRKTLAFAAALVLAAQPLAAEDQPELVIYTYESFVSEWGPGPAIAANFEETCGCAVRFVGAGDGAGLLGRLRLEGARSPADIVLGLDTNLIAEAKATGLFAAARDRRAGSRPAGRMDRRGLPALRLGLLRLRARQGGDAGPARQLRGADRVRRQHRHPRPAQLHPRPRPPDVGQGRLRRPRRPRSGRA